MRPPTSTAVRKPLRIVDHLVLIAIVALPLAAGAGCGRVSAGLAMSFAVAILVESQLLWWLLVQGGPERGGWLDRVVLPLFMGVTFLFLALSFFTYFHNPTAAVQFAVAQLAILLYMGLRP
jgi:hypothetical protein